MYLLAAPLHVLRVSHARVLRAASKSRFVVITVTAKAGQVLYVHTATIPHLDKYLFIDTCEYDLFIDYV